ncbi:hypothetical protein [Pontibacter sp. SGAir0037]|uniref:hypothetical protein n=1 Tax=Pontibacter sp. SGAir0037 TaxID=2571030 RepID=UPI0010CD480D|nr:hypothetical protein [Pontibacter sp. SGAir0037]QCR24943.1 hypothetical protein C1N53_06955 [Pontibacter sp. SGAir0037]
MIKAYKLYTGNDGHSYVAAGYVAEDISTLTTSIHFKQTPPNSEYDWHTAPTTQFVITLAGTLEFTTSLGDTFILQAGEILIATDTTGKGHKWRMLGDAPWVRSYIKFEHDTQVNFIPDPSESVA